MVSTPRSREVGCNRSESLVNRISKRGFVFLALWKSEAQVNPSRASHSGWTKYPEKETGGKIEKIYRLPIASSALSILPTCDALPTSDTYIFCSRSNFFCIWLWFRVGNIWAIKEKFLPNLFSACKERKRQRDREKQSKRETARNREKETSRERYRKSNTVTNNYRRSEIHHLKKERRDSSAIIASKSSQKQNKIPKRRSTPYLRVCCSCKL